LSKYNATRTKVDGIVFASKKEARRYSELRLLEKIGQVLDLELQPRFPVYIAPLRETGAVRVFTYIADFRYKDKDTGRIVIEDVKGVKTQVYKLKKRCVQAYYGIRISEV